MILDSRWQVGPEQFALRVDTTTDELRGLLKNSIVVEPGTRAYVIQEGLELGEIPPGEYAVQSFISKLAFWRKGQTTVVLTRSDIQAFEVPPSDCLTSDNLLVSVQARCSVQISDIGKFLQNLLGPRAGFSLSDLQERVVPLLRQSLWHAIGSRSSRQVVSPTVAHELSKQIEGSINLSFQRYGMRFVEVETLTTVSGELDEVLRSDSQLKLAALKEQGETDKLQADLETIRKRLPLREQLRDAVQSDRLDRVRTKEELEQFLSEVNKSRLLRQEELDGLVHEFENRKADRLSLRAHLTAVLDLNRRLEVQELRESVAHQLGLQSLRNEMELASLAGEKANLEWKRELQREIEEADHQNARRKTDLQAEWDRIREEQRQQQGTEWEDLAHRRKIESLRQEVEAAEAHRQKRVAILEQETAAELDRQRIEMERQRKDWELESTEKETLSQLDRLQRVQEMNLRLQERQERAKFDLDELKADKAYQRELGRMQAMSNLGTDALIASAHSENAALLADLKKHESTEQSKRFETEIGSRDQLDAERLRMYERLNDAERAKADAVTAAFREAMQGQQATVQQMIAGLAHASTPPGPVPVPLPSPGTVWYLGIDGQPSGPFDLATLKVLAGQGRLTISTQVWRQGMPSWTPASGVPELTQVLATAPPQLPHGIPPLG